MVAKKNPQPGRESSPGKSRRRASASAEKPKAATPDEAPLVPRDSQLIAPAPSAERTRYDGDSAIKLYLREIGQVALLTIQEDNIVVT